ncbi:MAG: alpha-galactosidase [Clostridia bacterium]|nr:alpha-galactosidase [Clostridia bacterium]
MKFDFFKKNFALGNIQSEAYILLDSEKITPNYTLKQEGEGLALTFSCEKFSDSLKIEKVKTGYTLTRVFENKSKDNMRLCGLGLRLSGIDFGFDKKDDYFYSVENPRIYETFTFPVDYNRTADDVESSEYDVIANNRWADPGVVSDKINDSPYQPFPAILLSNYKGKVGLVHGTLCQDLFFHSYLTGHDDGELYLDIFSSFKNVKYLEVESGRVLRDLSYIGLTDKADDINSLFDGYTEELRKALKNAWGRKDINRHELVWGSWNDGLFRNVTHDMLIKEAKALKKNFPMVKWFQLDDGYAKFHSEYNENTAAHGIGVAYQNDEGIDYRKFPKGLKAYADEVRALGLRPAVWIGGYSDKKSAVYMEHPDWFINYDYRIPNTAPFDYSVKEAREFLLSGLDLFLKEFGFEAVKHDFWSYQFETTGDFYKNLDKSGHEYRDWWGKEMRARLPEDGYMESCCDLAQGNPFLGKYFNNYRYGIDVASGKWENIKATIQWGTACMSTHTGDLYVPNSDSIGMFPALTFDEFLYWTNHVLITRSMVELAGLYSKEGNDQERVEVLKKATCCINNGDKAYFVNFDYRRSGKIIPEVIYINNSFFSLEENDVLPCRTVAVFNPDEDKKSVGFALSDLGLTGEYVLYDVWSGEKIKVSGDYCVELAPHSSKLYSVCRVLDCAILDSDLKLESVECKEKTLTFTIPYEKVGKIEFIDAPKGVEVESGEGELVGNYLKLSAKENCKVKVLF